MRSLEKTVEIPTDDDGFTSRKCPSCGSYFKVHFGTRSSKYEPLLCPRCGQKSSQRDLITPNQLEYAKSVAMNDWMPQIEKKLIKSFDSINRSRNSMFKIDVKTRGFRPRILSYKDQKLETYIECDNCKLRFAIYGVYGYCPECGIHNSLQTLKNNLSIAERLLDLDLEASGIPQQKLTENSLEDIVSSFDGYGRAIIAEFELRNPDRCFANKISFQNLDKARSTINGRYCLDIANSTDENGWNTVVRSFQKRHLISHKSGVIDNEYIAKSSDDMAISGRKITVTPDEVRQTRVVVEKIAESLYKLVRT